MQTLAPSSSGTAPSNDSPSGAAPSDLSSPRRFSLRCWSLVSNHRPHHPHLPSLSTFISLRHCSLIALISFIAPSPSGTTPSDDSPSGAAPSEIPSDDSPSSVAPSSPIIALISSLPLSPHRPHLFYRPRLQTSPAPSSPSSPSSSIPLCLHLVPDLAPALLPHLPHSPISLWTAPSNDSPSGAAPFDLRSLPVILPLALLPRLQSSPSSPHRSHLLYHPRLQSSPAAASSSSPSLPSSPLSPSSPIISCTSIALITLISSLPAPTSLSLPSSPIPCSPHAPVPPNPPLLAPQHQSHAMARAPRACTIKPCTAPSHTRHHL